MSTRFRIQQGGFVNQTDETERALRAITCPDGCGKNLSTVCNGVKPGMWHLTLTNSWLPCTYNPKLLPLFQQAVAGAYAAAAKAVQNLEFTYSPDSTPRQEAVAAILALTPADARQASQRPIGNRFHCFGEIIKNSNGEVLPVDEPLFLIRGRDYLAVPMLERYRKVCQEDGGNDYIDALFDEIIREFVRFSVDNPTKMKQPGSTRGL